MERKWNAGSASRPQAPQPAFDYRDRAEMERRFVASGRIGAVCGRAQYLKVPEIIELLRADARKEVTKAGTDSSCMVAP